MSKITIALEVYEKGDFMENVIKVNAKRSGRVKRENNNTIDTNYVLFFLAVELGNSFRGLSFEIFILSLTLISFLILPYWLNKNTGLFPDWILTRSVIALFAIGFGVVFQQTLGVLIPEIYGFLPMTFLIITAFLSVYFQFYSFLKLRIVK